jgi:uncharacterized protein involved in exopolysaccharide biosynthesis
LPDLELAEPLPIIAPEKTSAFRGEQLLEKIHLLWRKRQFLGRVTFMGLAMGLAAAFLIPKEFESTTRLMPPDSESSGNLAMLASLSAKAGPGLGVMAGNLLGLKSSGDLFIGILESRTVQDGLIDKFDLRKIYHKRLWQDARKKLAANTGIYEDRKSGIISLTVTDKDPHRAAAMAQAYVDELNQIVINLSTSGAHRERVFLEDRLKSVQQDLETAEKDFSLFASQNMAIDIPEQGKAMVTAAASLQGELIAAESELEGLRQIYADNNVRVRSVQARIAELKQQLDKVGGKGDDTTAGSASSSDALYPSIKKLPILGVTYTDMYRRTKVQEAVFEALTQQYELARVQEARETPSVKVLDPADVPEKKSFPPRTLIVLLGSLSLFVFGATWILGNVHWQQMNPNNPTKIVISGVYDGMQAHLEHAGRNGSRLGWVVRQARRFRTLLDPQSY